MKKEKIAVNFEALSEESKRSYCIPEFYVDETYRCVDCGKECVFKAETQKQWYEVKKKYIWKRPVRCYDHYLDLLDSKNSKIKMDQLLEELKKSDSKNLRLECAESIIDFFEKNGKGNLNMASHLLNSLSDFSSKKNKIDKLKEKLKNLKQI